MHYVEDLVEEGGSSANRECYKHFSQRCLFLRSTIAAAGKSAAATGPLLLLLLQQQQQQQQLLLLLHHPPVNHPRTLPALNCNAYTPGMSKPLTAETFVP